VLWSLISLFANVFFSFFRHLVYCLDFVFEYIFYCRRFCSLFSGALRVPFWVCVCVCALVSFYPLQLLDAHLNFWLLADFIVFNETDSCCCRWPCFCLVVVLILHCTRTLTRTTLSAGFGFQITRHLFSSGHSPKPI